MKLKQIILLPTWLFVRAYREYPILSITAGIIYFIQMGFYIGEVSIWLHAAGVFSKAVVDVVFWALVLFLLLPGIIAVWMFAHQFLGAFLRLLVRKPVWTPQKTIIDVVEWALK